MHTRVVLGVVFILLKILAPSASQDYGSNLSDSSNITFTTPTSYNSIHAESTSQPISESTTIETSSTKVTASTTTTTTTQESVLDEFQLPENCSDYKVNTVIKNKLISFLTIPKRASDASNLCIILGSNKSTATITCIDNQEMLSNASALQILQWQKVLHQ